MKPESEVPFPAAEYRRRSDAIKKGMKEAGVEVLYLSAPESMCYVSGYQSEWYQAQGPKYWLPMSGIAISVDEPDFILFDIVEELTMTKYTTISKDTRIFPGLDTWNMHKWVASELEREGWVPATVGLEMWSYRPNRIVSEMFQKELEKVGCKVVDATDIVRNVRWVKSALELQMVRKAGKIADVGMRAAMECMKPGMTELEVYGEIVGAMARAGGENPGITMPVVSGPKSACVHALSSRKKIRKGEIVNIDVCGVYNRYHVNMARTFSMGRPDTDVAHVVELSAKAFDVLEEIMYPNMPVKDLVAAMKDYYHRAGIEQDSWWYGGYELGISFPPDWVGSFVYDAAIDNGDATFRPGTVVNYESNFYLPKRMGLSLLINTLLFDRHKAEILGTVSDDLIVI